MDSDELLNFSNKIFETLGPGYKEHLYVNAMTIHLREKNYLFATEVIVPIEYNGIQIGFTRADIVIYKPFKCVLEFKAQSTPVSKKEFTQLNQYLVNLKYNNGILINFGNVLEFHTVDLNENKKKIIKIEL